MVVGQHDRMEETVDTIDYTSNIQSVRWGWGKNEQEYFPQRIPFFDTEKSF